MKNLPNILTGSRIIFVFLFVILANFDATNKNCIAVSEQTANVCHMIAYILAILGGLTDQFDGYLARKYHVESDFGRLMDPLADKLFIMATFSMLVDYQYMPAWILIVILSREFMVTGLRTLAAGKGVVIPADRWGKMKTASQMTALALCGMSWVVHPICASFPDFRDSGAWHIGWMILLCYVALITLLSGLGYFVRYKKLFLSSMFNEEK